MVENNESRKLPIFFLLFIIKCILGTMSGKRIWRNNGLTLHSREVQILHRNFYVNIVFLLKSNHTFHTVILRAKKLVGNVYGHTLKRYIKTNICMNSIHGLFYGRQASRHIYIHTYVHTYVCYKYACCATNLRFRLNK